METFTEYEAFEKDWKKRHKASLPRKQSVSSISAVFWIGFWVIVSIGAAIFSAAHTIPAAEMTLFQDLPHRSGLAITAFVIVEFVIFGASAKRREISWMKWLLTASMLVALIGNTSSSIRAVSENGGDTLNQVAGVLLSIIAPLTALAAGEVLHMQLSQLAQKRQEAEIIFQQHWKEVEVKINTAYTKAEKEWKAQQHKVSDFELINSLNLIKNNQNSQRDKPSPRLQKAITWLEQNPDQLATAPRELEDAIGVGYGTIWKAQQHIKSSMNGHDSNDEPIVNEE